MPKHARAQRAELLPPDALRGKALGISVSESPDLNRLGLFDDQLRMTLGELTRAVIVAGGDLYYGGHLEEDGYTRFLIDELQRYGRRDRPLKVCLAWTEHRKMSAAEKTAQYRLLGLFGEIAFLSQKGERLKVEELNEIETDFSDDVKADSLRSLRKFMIEKTHARILLGGKRSGFQGDMPGIVEEALISLERRQALYLAGGFGGATLDLVRTIRPENAAWLPEQKGEAQNARLTQGLEQLRKLIEDKGWDGQKNGLDPDENRLLAASYRPSEIAALVGLGMGRLLAE